MLFHLAEQSSSHGQSLTVAPPHSIADTGRLGQTVRGTPMITTNYPNSNTTGFDLSSFYFGCVVALGNNVAAAPVQCLIEATGYKGNDNQVSNAVETCAQQFQYNPSTMLGPQQFAFSGPLKQECFTDVQFVIFTYGPPGGLAALSSDTSLGIDDVAYTYRTCKKV